MVKELEEMAPGRGLASGASGREASSCSKLAAARLTYALLVHRIGI